MDGIKRGLIARVDDTNVVKVIGTAALAKNDKAARAARNYEGEQRERHGFHEAKFVNLSDSDRLFLNVDVALAYRLLDEPPIESGSRAS